MADRWGCQVTTARARREQALKNLADVLEECARMGDTERMGAMWDVLEAAAVVPDPETDPIHRACRADLEEDLAELEHRRHPNRHNAKRWLEHLGRESRLNVPAMARLRQEWSL